MQLISLLIVSMPWLAGGFLALVIYLVVGSSVRDREKNKKDLPSVFIFGLGSLLGYLILGYALSALNKFDFPALTLSLNIVIATISVLSILAYSQMASCEHRYSSNKAYWIILTIVFSLIAYDAYMQKQTPMFGWDSLNHWGRKAAELTEQISVYGSETLYYHEYSRHPKTIVLVNTWAAWTSNQLGSQDLATPWLLCMISLLMLSAGYVHSITGSEVQAALCALLTATLPLVEAHTIIFGYAELWMACVVLASTLLVAFGIREREVGWQVAGILIAALALTIKNIGLVYAASIWGAFIYTLLLQRPLLATTLTSALVFSGYILWREGFALEAIGMRVYWAPEANELYFGGRALKVFSNPADQVVINELHSLAINQSFSTAALVLFFGAIAAISGLARNLGNRGSSLSIHSATHPIAWEPSAVFLSLTVTLSLLILMLSQLFLPFSYDHALPNNDTGNSRFSIPLVLLSIPIGLTIITPRERRLSGVSFFSSK